MKLLFIDGTSGYYPGRIYQKPSGGIVTSLHHVPRFLAAQGHDVYLISVHETAETAMGVKHLNSAEDIKPDVVIFNRNLMNHALVDRYRDAYKIWWLHDIMEPSYMEDDSFKRMDAVVALSRYCVESYADFYGLDPRKFTVIPNGVDRAVFFPGTQPRERNLFVQASAPIKGLHPLAFAFANLKRNCPEVRLVLYADQNMHGMENTKGMAAQLDALRAAGAEVNAPVPQQDIADVFRRAYALLMPNHYPEICSNVLLQARACGLPVIASNIGSAAEFIEHEVNGLLTTAKPHDMWWWQKDFAALCVGLAMSPEFQERLSVAAPKGVLSWAEIGEKWSQLVSSCLVEAV